MCPVNRDCVLSIETVLSAVDLKCLILVCLTNQFIRAIHYKAAAKVSVQRQKHGNLM